MGNAADGPKPLRLLIAGTYDRSAAYPNVLGRVLSLLRDERYATIEAHVPTSIGIAYGSRRSRAFTAVRALARLAGACFRTFVAVVRRRDRAVLYVPYPAALVLWVLGWVPRRFRPHRTVADAVISLYDTVVEDRRLLCPGSIPARLLWRLERRAFRTADTVVVDTPENAAHYAGLLDVDPRRFAALPLAMPHAHIDATAYAPRPLERFQLVFVGTMVPLHGIEILCDAVARLPAHLGIDVRLYGDGQCSPSVQRLVDVHADADRERGGVRVSWVREWLDEHAVAQAIASADLCVGVMGTTDKSDRVWPYKNYLYMASGRALVNARTSAAAGVERLCGRSCFLGVPPGDAAALADLIERAVVDRESLRLVAAAGRQAFVARLSGRFVDDALFEILRGGDSAAGSSDGWSVRVPSSVEQQPVTHRGQPGQVL